VIWAPKQVTLPHDHRMSAVIGMYGGREATHTTRWPVLLRRPGRGAGLLGKAGLPRVGWQKIGSVAFPNNNPRLAYSGKSRARGREVPKLRGHSFNILGDPGSVG
jgi:hypothetical protein